MINIADFINREIIHRDNSMFLPDLIDNRQKLSSLVDGRKVLVIGGAGSIGSAFVKEILPFHPSQLFVIDINENGLTELTRDLRSSYSLYVPPVYKTYPINYYDPIFRKLFIENKGFDIVVNFSAHKHVRSEKDCWCIRAMFENNVIHAKHLLDLLSEYPTEHFFCVSTDKAANPVNIMGASKRIMEDLIMSFSNSIKITTARFANVAFSNGSLLYGFHERLMKHQPLSSPNDVRRFFVSPQESGQICLLACLLGNNREIFFPKLNNDQMMKFSDIAVKFLHECGYSAKECKTEEEAKAFAYHCSRDCKEYPVYFFKSDTTGEKLYEEFYTTDETIDLNRFKSLGVIQPQKTIPQGQVLELISNLQSVFDKDSIFKEEIVDVIKDYLPNFTHNETFKNLDDKM